MSADGRYQDAKFMKSVFISLPILPEWKSCMPKVRDASSGYLDYSHINNRIGSSHHPYERYYHESVVEELKNEIIKLKTSLEQHTNGRAES